MSVCRPDSGQGEKVPASFALWKRLTFHIATLLSHAFFILGCYAPSLHVGVFSFRSSSRYEFAVLAALSCMTLCTSSHVFLTIKQFSLTFIPRFCSQAALELSFGHRDLHPSAEEYRKMVTVKSVCVYTPLNRDEHNV